MINRQILLTALSAAALAAQTNSGTLGPVILPAPAGAPVPVRAVLTSTAMGGGFAESSLRQVTGQPFSAQEETETVQILADGTRIANPAQKVMHYRDSLGRTRTERTPARMPGFLGASPESNPPVFIEIVDPVGGYRYSFDSVTHKANRSTFTLLRLPNGIAPSPATSVRPANRVSAGIVTSREITAPDPSATAAGARQPRPEMLHESLDTRTIEGILAEGTKTTTTYPIGFFGNDRPLITSTEIWTSPEIGMTILTINSDPRSGETTTKLTNISRAEPDPSLFQPPAGYEIVDPQIPLNGR